MHIYKLNNKSSKTNKHLKWYSTLFIAVILIFCTLIFSWLLYISKYPEENIYFSESLDNKVSNYRSLDCTWLIEDGKNGVIQLSQKNFAAPNLVIKLPKFQPQPQDYVLHFKVKVSSFSNDNLTLASLFLPTLPVVVVTNQEGRLGFAHDLFQVPIYASNFSTKLKKNRWEDICVYFNSKKKVNELYLNNEKILVEKWDTVSYPLEEIRLGSLWLIGKPNYGSPLNVSYDDISLGTSGLLPKPSFFEFVKRLLAS